MITSVMRLVRSIQIFRVRGEREPNAYNVRCSVDSPLTNGSSSASAASRYGSIYGTITV